MFGNADGEAYLSYWTQETQELAADVTPHSVLVDLTVYPSTAAERDWFFRREKTQPMPTEPATLALVLAYAREH